MKNYFVKEVIHYCNITTNKRLPIVNQKIGYYDLTFILGGNIKYTVDGRNCVLKKNDAVFIRPGSVRSRDGFKENIKYVSFNFHLLDGVELPFDSFLINCVTTELKKLFDVFPQAHLSAYYHSEEKLSNMLNYVLFELMEVTAAKCSNDHVLKILRYIDAHTNERLSLADISEKINLSREYTANIFKKEMGKTLTEYVNERKMLLAKEMIMSGELTLEEISNRLGYNNYNYFSRLFKKHFSMTPIHMRKI